MTDEPTCPICGEPLTYDEVDIGVGIQTGNYRCDCCGWYPERDDEEYCSYATGMEV
jgi:transposase